MVTIDADFPFIRPKSPIPVDIFAINTPRPAIDVSDDQGCTAAINKSCNSKMKVVLFCPMGVERYAPVKVSDLGSFGGLEHAAGG